MTDIVKLPPYSEAQHRAILALWSAHSHRSFESLTDKFHRMEVEYLRPGTHLPSSSTISRDVRAIHAKYAPKVREYFQSIHGAIHLVVDGWTSPTSNSYIGLVVVWYDRMTIYRSILDFTRVTSTHTGKNLAELVVSCLRQYGLENKILSAALDNASNNLSMVHHLQQLVPHFLGERSYVRCLAHIINLMAKAFMAPFTYPSKRTKQVLDSNATNPMPSRASAQAVHEFLQVQKLPRNPENPENPEVNDADTPDSAEVDEAEFVHDTLVAQAMVLKAIEQLSAQYGIAPTASQLRSAQGIMPIVAGLARQVDESPVLTGKLHEAIAIFPALQGSEQKALSRRVPTCWGSDRKALDDHIHLRQPVQWLTSELKLSQFALKYPQWMLAEELNEALEVFEIPTAHFSAGSVPLVHGVLPKLVELKETLETVQASGDISPVTRVGTQAALNVFDKYMNNMSICKVYFISIVMCPDIKLNWIRKHYDNQSVQWIREMICARFHLRYPSTADAEAPKPLMDSSSKPQNLWLHRSPAVSFGQDSIEAYLDEDTVALKPYGGLLPYWSAMLESKPRIAHTALDYLTAP
ncbi:hypothetical protein FRC06_005430, partial [Ceratobasidium sp. 370]